MIQRVFLIFLMYLVFIDNGDLVMVRTEWNGDPKICTMDQTEKKFSNPSLPLFPNQAQFMIENALTRSISGSSNLMSVNRREYLYDYTNNLMIQNSYVSGLVQQNLYQYGMLKRMTYLDNKFCVVTDIPQNIAHDSSSAIQLDDGSWHIRPLNEILLFSSSRPNEPIITPKYVGRSMIRGIKVDQWESCIVDKSNNHTSRRLWSFAANKTITASNDSNTYSVPIHLSIFESFSLSNASDLVETNSSTHIIAFRAGIVADVPALKTPKGVFCSNSNHDFDLSTLSELGIIWPRQFTVRVDVSTSQSHLWRSFKFYFKQSVERTILRYDYRSKETEQLITLILDQTHNLTYTIDQHTGTCIYHLGVEFIDVNPIARPIEFLMKHQNFLIQNPPQKSWSFDGFRGQYHPCRGEDITCVIARTSINNYPPRYESDTDRPTGDYWSATNIEYAWSMRSPFVSSTSSENSPRFDYPVSLFLRFYKFNNTSDDPLNNLKIEELEYQFYEMSSDVHVDDFDLSTCYRVMNLSYLHLAFVLLPIDNRLLIDVQLDRQILESEIRCLMIQQLKVASSRISDLQIELIPSGNSIYIFFTLLDRSPLSMNTEITIETARTNLQNSIDSTEFKINIKLLDDDQSLLALWAPPKSLKTSKEFMSIHSNWPSNNVPNCNVSSTNFTNTNSSQCNSSIVYVSIVYQPKIINEKYSSVAEMGGVFGGLVVGIVVGFVSILIIRLVRKKYLSNTIVTNGNSIINPHANRSGLSLEISMREIDRSIGNQIEE